MHSDIVDLNRQAGAGDEVSVFRSNKSFEADMIVAALEEAGIPCFQRVHRGPTDGPISASAADWVGPFCCVYVPRSATEEAMQIVMAFPFVEELKEPLPADAAPPVRLSRTAVLIVIAVLLLMISLAIGL